MTKKRKYKYQWQPTWVDYIIYSILFMFFIGLIVLCLLYFNNLKTIWLVYIGVIIILIAFLVFGGLSKSAFKKYAKTSNNENWLDTKVVVERGIYSVVRHPIYLSFMMYVMGLIFISQHWLSLFFGIPIIVLMYQCMRDEEKNNIAKFGNDYKLYMKKVPRANFMLGIIRYIRRRNRGHQTGK